MKSPRFKPHFNRELGKTYYSSRDYVADMKKAGIEPYNPSGIKHNAPKPYVESEWARSMKQDIVDRKGRPAGGRFVDELKKRGYTQEKADYARKLAEEKR